MSAYEDACEQAHENSPARQGGMHFSDRNAHRPYGLSKREVEVVKELVAGATSNVEMGKRLFVTEQTVKFHLGNIFEKVGVTDRTALAVKWVREQE